MIELSEQQRHELCHSEPIGFDPETQWQYVLIPKEVYDLFKALLLDETVYTTAESLDQVMAADDAFDPYLAELQIKYGGKTA